MGKRKKIEKNRGRRECNKGTLKKWRGKGQRGGRGFAGSKKHRKSWILRYAPKHIGKPKGFVPKNKKEIRAVNVGEIEALAEKGKKEIDIGKLGYDKVIGKGRISKPLTVKADTFSRKAQEKIEGAGGKAIAEVGQEEVEEKPSGEKKK